MPDELTIKSGAWNAALESIITVLKNISADMHSNQLNLIQVDAELSKLVDEINKQKVKS